MRLKLINPIHYYKELVMLLRYIRRPVAVVSNTNNPRENVLGTWNIFVIKTVLTIIIGLLITAFIDPTNQTTVRWTEIYTTGTIFLLSIIILPVLEEIAFRLSLKFNPTYFSLTFAVLAYYFCTKLIFQTNLSNVDDHLAIRVGVSIAVCIALYILLHAHSKIRKRLQLIWRLHFKWVFYFFCITFAWMHILNYELNLTHLLLMPIITLPKLISAISYGYIRMHYGFIYSLGLHMAWNSIGFIITMIPIISAD